MRRAPNGRSNAFTFVELIVVIVVIAVVFALVAKYQPREARASSYNIRCYQNLRQIGEAYRLWQNDHNNRDPAGVSVTDGGWADYLTNADQGYLCWTNYALLASYLGRSNAYAAVDFPKGLVCPSDEREPANSFTNFGNLNLSYFVGVSSRGDYPDSLLGGDRNLSGGTEPGHNYGFSPENGKGNDVAIQTNSKAGPVCWSLEMHSLKNGEGNIMLGDGAVITTWSHSFSQEWQPKMGLTANWPRGHLPSFPSVRILFP